LNLEHLLNLRKPVNPIEKPAMTPIMTSTPEYYAPVSNPNDCLIIPRHPDPRIKPEYLGINDKPEELKPPMIYEKIDGRTAQIMLKNSCNTYILYTDFVNAGNTPYFPYKPIPVELAVHNTSQFTLNTQTKRLLMEVDNIIQSEILYP
jgi:hypothetical protein